MASRLKVREDSTASSWVSDGISPDTPINPSSDNLVFFGAPTDSGGTLPRGSIVEILKEGHFFLNRRAAPFAFVRVISLPTGKKSSLAEGETGWVSGLDKYLKRRPSAMPAWMQKAKVHGVFNQIVNLYGDQRITVSAGDKIGHAAHYELPDDKSCTFSHLEIFSQDNRLPDFVNNKADITLGAKLLKSEAGKTLWLHRKQGNCFVVKGGDEPRYTHATHYTSLMDANKIETEGKIWYFIAKEHGWLPASEVTEVEQYNLSERGFLMLSQDEQPSDITQGFHESWVHRVISTLNLRASEQNGLYSLRVSELYQSLLRRWDLDGDGKLSYVELWKGLHNRESWCQDIVQRLIVKHHSEWRHAADSTLWKPTLAELAKRYPSLAQYNQVQINDLVWMEEVPEIRCEEALWHMHPIIFLDAIANSKITLGEARVRAFMRMIRVGEGTVGDVGYETLFGGQSFIKDYNKNFSDHPQVSITRGKLTSSAAGAYQVMGYTWMDSKMISQRIKNGINDFSPRSQDEFCVVILKHKRKKSLEKIMSGDIDGALNLLSYEWASLPPGRYGQPVKTREEVISYYNIYLKEELSGKTDLHITAGYIDNIAKDK